MRPFIGNFLSDEVDLSGAKDTDTRSSIPGNSRGLGGVLSRYERFFVASVRAVTLRVAMPLRRDRDDETFELAALADDSLSPEQRSLLEAQAAASPELSERLAEQQAALALTRSAVDGVEAPQGLRSRVEAQRRARTRPAQRRLVLAALATAAVVGVIALGVVTLSPSGSGPR